MLVHNVCIQFHILKVYRNWKYYKKTKIVPDYINIGVRISNNLSRDLIPQSLESYFDEIKK